MSGETGRAFLDTTIAIYCASDVDEKGVMARNLLATADLVISVQVLNEFVSVGHGKLKWPWERVQEALAGLRSVCETIVPSTVETHDLAVELSRRYRYHIYDSMMLASAIQAGCDVLYSEDMQHGQRVEGVTIRNPFR